MKRKEDEYYMRRAIALAGHGHGHVSPNPAVGCVIVSADGRIAGEGWHRSYGQGHAEVNAVAAVRDSGLLKDATVYVTLEPCAHYGKTPPCAAMLAQLPVARVVAGCTDPNPKVSGKGLGMLRDAGKEVESGVLEKECRSLNPSFLTAHEKGRPFITLKWACGADGNMGDSSGQRMIYSDATGRMLAHRLRTRHDAIMIGRRTAIADDPALDVRNWPGRSPRPIVTGGDGSPAAGLRLAGNSSTLWLPHTNDPWAMVRMLWHRHNISSLLVEGGAELLQLFIDAKLWDRIRRETNPDITGGDITAPHVPAGAKLLGRTTLRRNRIETWAI